MKCYTQNTRDFQGFQRMWGFPRNFGNKGHAQLSQEQKCSPANHWKMWVLRNLHFWIWNVSNTSTLSYQSLFSLWSSFSSLYISSSSPVLGISFFAKSRDLCTYICHSWVLVLIASSALPFLLMNFITIWRDQRRHTVLKQKGWQKIPRGGFDHSN